MTKVNYHITQNSITLNFEGKTMQVARGDSRFSKVILAIKENRLTDIPQIVDLAQQFAKDGFRLVDGQIITPTGEALPVELNARILEFKKEELPFTHLLKFWENLKENPSFRSREQLFKFLEHNGHPLTEDGCFIAYRGVTEDFKDKHTRTFDNSPGAICEMPRSQVDDDPTRTCSAGLHVAAWGYASNWSEQRVEVKVNPKDVVAVPVDYNGEKMRVCKFEVIQVCEKPLENQALYGRENQFLDDEELDYDEYDEDDYDEEAEYLQAKNDDIVFLAKQFPNLKGNDLVYAVCVNSFENEESVRFALEQEGLI